MSKNVAVFVDVANIFYAAKAAGVDIDYVTLLKASSAGRDLVRAYAYTGLDPDNENQRNFHDFLRRHGYKVVSKDIRKYGDGKVKANLDIELVVDMMKTARNLDIAIVVSGDGDFAPAIRAVQEMGVRVEVISFRGNTSSDLIDVADQFTEITQVAKVEKGSSRSGRRVATDDEDLSMTEVPDKLSEGTGDGRRGRGRGRTRTAETPVAAEAPRARRTSTRTPAPIAASGDVPIVVLPGEKLSRVAPAASRAIEADMDEEAGELVAADPEAPSELNGHGDAEGEEMRRRRRRRGGRGRGRGRGRDGLPLEGEAGPASREPIAADDIDPDAEAEDAEPTPSAPARRPAFSFGSVWDSQIGIPSSGATARPAAARPSIDDDEDIDEPPIPEYLIAERRQRDAQGRGRGPVRGGRGGAYADAVNRERYGRGAVSRYAEPAGRPRDAGPRDSGPRDLGPNRGPRPAPRQFDRPDPRGTSDEPWSEVPPEIEAMLRAQLGSAAGRPAQGRTAGNRPAPRPEPEAAPAAGATMGADAAAAAPEAGATPKRATRSRAPRAAAATTTDAAPAETAAPKPRRTSRASAASAEGQAPAAKPVRRRTAAAAGSDATSAGDGPAKAAPKPRATRKKAASTD